MSDFVPCGHTIGHGETCQPGYLCGHCERIAELEADNKEFLDGMERMDAKLEALEQILRDIVDLRSTFRPMQAAIDEAERLLEVDR